MTELPPFACEQWMTKYEKQAIYNLTDTSIQALSLNALLASCHADLPDVLLDYGDITGSDRLKAGILSLYETGDPQNITTADGCLNAGQLVMDALLEEGDEVITFTPGYQQFIDYPRSRGANVRLLDYKEEAGWKIDLSELEEAVNDQTKMIILNSPSNPTGCVLEQAELEEIVRIARAHDVWVLNDEVYRWVGMPIPSVSDLYEKGIAIASLSKSFSLAGLRLGWIKADQALIERINEIRDYTIISAPVLSDALGCLALENRDVLLNRNNEIIQTNKAFLEQWLKENPSFSMQIPKAGSVGFLKYDFDMDSETFSRRLMEETGVFLVPGMCFSREGYVRLGLGIQPEKFANGLYVLGKWANQML